MSRRRAFPVLGLAAFLFYLIEWGPIGGACFLTTYLIVRTSHERDRKR